MDLSQTYSFFNSVKLVALLDREENFKVKVQTFVKFNDDATEPAFPEKEEKEDGKKKYGWDSADSTLALIILIMFLVFCVIFLFCYYCAN